MGQLVVTRRIGEVIHLPTVGVRIQITGVRANGTVRVGIEAPPDVEIVRAELLTRSRRVQK